VQSFDILDHTMYPNTLDPMRLYTPEDPIDNYKIIGLAQQQDKWMLELDFVSFTFPI